MTDEPLLATCWTTAGDAAPLRGDERSPIPVRDRIEAAAAAGFRGIGLLHLDLTPALDQYGVRGLRALLDDNDLIRRLQWRGTNVTGTVEFYDFGAPVTINAPAVTAGK